LRVLTLVGSLALPALLFLAFVGCGVEAERFNAGKTVRAGEFEVSMNPDPNPPKSGRPVLFTFEIRREGDPFEGTAPRLTVDMPDMPMNLPEVPLEPAGAGRWEARIQLPMAGEWVATLELPSGDRARFEFDVAP